MKENPSLKIGPVFLLVIAIPGIFAAQPVRAVPVGHTIQLTENSSTDLTATYDGSLITVSNLAPDQWAINFPGTVDLFGIPTWMEPENPLRVNMFTTGTQPNQAIVGSDFSSQVPGAPIIRL